MMAATWCFIGLILTFTVYVLLRKRADNGVSWTRLCLTGFGVCLILFSIAWGVASVLEGVPRAASMGLLLFGLPGIVLTTYGFRLVMKSNSV